MELGVCQHDKGGLIQLLIYKLQGWIQGTMDGKKIIGNAIPQMLDKLLFKSLQTVV